MALTSLVYVSLANKDMQESDLAALLSQARRNNEKLSITGMLLYRDRLFMQALEGEEDRINALYERIRQDSRHRDVTTVSIRPIEARSFADWTMGFSLIDNETVEGMEGYTDFLENPSRLFCRKAQRRPSAPGQLQVPGTAITARLSPSAGIGITRPSGRCDWPTQADHDHADL